MWEDASMWSIFSLRLQTKNYCIALSFPEQSGSVSIHTNAFSDVLPILHQDANIISPQEAHTNTHPKTQSSAWDALLLRALLGQIPNVKCSR